VTPDDWWSARRLDRDSRAAARANARVLRLHTKAAARRERMLRRARKAMPVQAVTAAGSATGVVVLGLGSWWYVLSVGAALAALRSLRTLRRPPTVPALPPGATLTPPPAPPRGSAALPAVRRLEDARIAFLRLLPLVAPHGRDVAEEAWRAAAEADLALRWQAARLAGVEPHRGAEPALVDQLYSGVVAQERLVAGLADLVSASVDPLASRRLQEATDALHGLAQGMREVR
jgi:hypothetical protein